MPTSELRGRRETAHQRVRAALTEEIMSGRLPGGTRLIQAEIAERLGCSITPVREALRDLATEGLVRFDAHRGAVVHRPDLAEMREVYEMRRRLEPLVLELAVQHITPEALDRARDLHEQMLAEPVPARWVELNRSFHGVFMEACGWRRLAQTVALLHATAAPYVNVTMSLRPDFMLRGNDDHAQMIQACVDGDTARAAALAEAHMDITKLAIEQQLGGSADAESTTG
jgi:DNA-binding GntR family transcriptional regulator